MPDKEVNKVNVDVKDESVVFRGGGSQGTSGCCFFLL